MMQESPSEPRSGTPPIVAGALTAPEREPGADAWAVAAHESASEWAWFDDDEWPPHFGSARLGIP